MQTRSSVVAVVTLAALLQTAAIRGQTNRGSGQRSTQNVTYQTATTKSGRTVILKSNGTWVYADESSANESNAAQTAAPTPATKPAAARGTSSLSIETGVVMQSGDVTPLARTSFLLLDDDLATILRNAGFRPSANAGGLAGFGYGIASGNILSTFLLSWRYDTLRADKETYARAISIIRPHVRANSDTDFKGKAQLTGVTPGVYYVTGWYWLNGQGIVWSVKTHLKPGVNTVIIDQNNAALVGGG